MKAISAAVAEMSQSDISKIEREGVFTLNIPEGPIEIGVKDVEILSEDIPGWLVANEGKFTVALDVTIALPRPRLNSSLPIIQYTEQILSHILNSPA